MTLSRFNVVFNLPTRYITVNKKISGGQPLLRGTRVPVDLIFDFIVKGWSIGELPAHFPGIDTSLVEKLVRYRSIESSRDELKEKRK
ncbi:DUF433 domain-containing protein [Patescibacteria group bacterium]|nr:DUF433 domain-containing protein [Patescibacteria group bacterium]